MPASPRRAMETTTRSGDDLSGDGTTPAVLVLTAADTSLLVAVGEGLPRVLHWGARVPAATGPLEDADGGFLQSLRASQFAADGLTGNKRIPALLPEQSGGWMGTPGIEGHRNGRDFSSRFASGPWRLTTSGAAEQRLEATAEDPQSALRVRTTLELTPTGVLRVQAELENTGADGLTVNSVRLFPPVPLHGT